MGSSVSCNSGHGQSLRVKDGFHSPTLTCSEPKSLAFPKLRLNPIEYSESEESYRDYRRRRRRSQSSSSSLDTRSRSYHSSSREYEKPKSDLRIKVPGKTVRFTTPAAPRDDKRTSHGSRYETSASYWSATPWAAPVTPSEHIDIVYTPRPTNSRSRRR